MTGTPDLTHPSPEPIPVYAASLEDCDRAGHLRITAELLYGDESTTLGAFIRAADFDAALRAGDQAWARAGVEAVGSAVFSALHDQAGDYWAMAGALWIACRNTDFGRSVEQTVRGVLAADGHAHLVIAYDTTNGQLLARLEPLDLPH